MIKPTAGSRTNPLDGPCVIKIVDPTPKFMVLRDDSTLKKFRFTLEIGRVKDPNKILPHSEKAIFEIEEELRPVARTRWGALNSLRSCYCHCATEYS